jgi:L-lactate dehydrogenase complex protein LldG
MTRDEALDRVRTALGRTAGGPVPEPPAVLLQPSASPVEERVVKFTQALTALAGKVAVVGTLAEARTHVESVLAGRRAIASHAPILETSGIVSLPGVSTEFSREACAAAEVGITSADYALADTGTLVMLTGSHESRMLSLLPPCHIAVIEREKLLESLDQFFAVVPKPGAQSSGMVLITGPSRTADIEMRLVRGVHGPGEIHVIVVGDVTAFPSEASEHT